MKEITTLQNLYLTNSRLLQRKIIKKEINSITYSHETSCKSYNEYIHKMWLMLWSFFGGEDILHKMKHGILFFSELLIIIWQFRFKRVNYPVLIHLQTC